MTDWQQSEQRQAGGEVTDNSPHRTPTPSTPLTSCSPGGRGSPTLLRAARVLRSKRDSLRSHLTQLHRNLTTGFRLQRFQKKASSPPPPPSAPAPPSLLHAEGGEGPESSTCRSGDGGGGGSSGGGGSYGDAGEGKVNHTGGKVCGAAASSPDQDRGWARGGGSAGEKTESLRGGGGRGRGGRGGGEEEGCGRCGRCGGGMVEEESACIHNAGTNSPRVPPSSSSTNTTTTTTKPCACAVEGVTVTSGGGGGGGGGGAGNLAPRVLRDFGGSGTDERVKMTVRGDGEGCRGGADSGSGAQSACGQCGDKEEGCGGHPPHPHPAADCSRHRVSGVPADCSTASQHRKVDSDSIQERHKIAKTSEADDELPLGSEANSIVQGQERRENGVAPQSAVHKRFLSVRQWGGAGEGARGLLLHSGWTSFNSDASNLTSGSATSASSLDLLLQSRQVDSEQLLLNLGFGGPSSPFPPSSHPMYARIPHRFLLSSSSSQQSGEDVGGSSMDGGGEDGVVPGPESLSLSLSGDGTPSRSPLRAAAGWPQSASLPQALMGLNLLTSLAQQGCSPLGSLVPSACPSPLSASNPSLAHSLHPGPRRSVLHPDNQRALARQGYYGDRLPQGVDPVEVVGSKEEEEAEEGMGDKVTEKQEGSGAGYGNGSGADARRKLFHKTRSKVQQDGEHPHPHSPHPRLPLFDSFTKSLGYSTTTESNDSTDFNTTASSVPSPLGSYSLDAGRSAPHRAGPVVASIDDLYLPDKEGGSSSSGLQQYRQKLTAKIMSDLDNDDDYQVSPVSSRQPTVDSAGGGAGQEDKGCSSSISNSSNARAGSPASSMVVEEGNKARNPHLLNSTDCASVAAPAEHVGRGESCEDSNQESDAFPEAVPSHAEGFSQQPEGERATISLQSVVKAATVVDRRSKSVSEHTLLDHLSAISEGSRPSSTATDAPDELTSVETLRSTVPPDSSVSVNASGGTREDAVLKETSESCSLAETPESNVSSEVSRSSQGPSSSSDDAKLQHTASASSTKAANEHPRTALESSTSPVFEGTVETNTTSRTFPKEETGLPPASPEQHPRTQSGSGGAGPSSGAGGLPASGREVEVKGARGLGRQEAVRDTVLVLYHPTSRLTSQAADARPPHSLTQVDQSPPEQAVEKGSGNQNEELPRMSSIQSDSSGFGDVEIYAENVSTQEMALLKVRTLGGSGDSSSTTMTSSTVRLAGDGHSPAHCSNTDLADLTDTPSSPLSPFDTERADSPPKLSQSVNDLRSDLLPPGTRPPLSNGRFVSTCYIPALFHTAKPRAPAPSVHRNTITSFVSSPALNRDSDDHRHSEMRRSEISVVLDVRGNPGGVYTDGEERRTLRAPRDSSDDNVQSGKAFSDMSSTHAHPHHDHHHHHHYHHKPPPVPHQHESAAYSRKVLTYASSVTKMVNETPLSEELAQASSNRVDTLFLSSAPRVVSSGRSGGSGGARSPLTRVPKLKLQTPTLDAATPPPDTNAVLETGRGRGEDTDKEDTLWNPAIPVNPSSLSPVEREVDGRRIVESSSLWVQAVPSSLSPTDSGGESRVVEAGDGGAGDSAAEGSSVCSGVSGRESVSVSVVGSNRNNNNNNYSSSGGGGGVDLLECQRLMRLINQPSVIKGRQTRLIHYKPKRHLRDWPCLQKKKRLQEETRLAQYAVQKYKAELGLMDTSILFPYHTATTRMTAEDREDVEELQHLWSEVRRQATETEQLLASRMTSLAASRGGSGGGHEGFRSLAALSVLHRITDLLKEQNFQKQVAATTEEEAENDDPEEEEEEEEEEQEDDDDYYHHQEEEEGWGRMRRHPLYRGLRPWFPTAGSWAHIPSTAPCPSRSRLLKGRYSSASMVHLARRSSPPRSSHQVPLEQLRSSLLSEVRQEMRSSLQCLHQGLRERDNEIHRLQQQLMQQQQRQQRQQQRQQHHQQHQHENHQQQQHQQQQQQVQQQQQQQQQRQRRSRRSRSPRLQSRSLQGSARRSKYNTNSKETEI
ncbi:uncharacterized protein LOC143292493 [Babylonia areolata]|uniref:uncharacterized protein LOC143292493 n=1 Tax=Babylonia areolata TaxID=304850 RepID=UPI003FD50FBF